MNLTNRPALGLKVKEKKKDAKYLAWLHEQSCIICEMHAEPQNSPTQAHHCIHGRYSTSKASDSHAIPLCEGHHQGLWDQTKIAVHKEPSAWKDQYGLDTDYIDIIRNRYPK
jgi:hypothetical protein